MTIYDGIVEFDDGVVPVIIGVEEDSLRMSSGGAEIGEWGNGEFDISEAGGGVYTITAENESLRFVPNDPSLFAARLNEGRTPVPDAEEEEPTRAHASTVATGPPIPGARPEAPPPKPVTVVAFYALAGVTAFLGLWALVSLLF